MTKQNLNIEDKVVSILKSRHMTVATAESCTGGLVAATLINVSGVSDVIKESYITYADETKHRILKVSNKTLERFTAVSEETAREMVCGLTEVAGTDVGISVTGIAGPDGGSEKFPVGLVYLGFKIREKVWVRRYVFEGDRMQVRQQSVAAALSTLLTLLKEEDNG